MRPRTGGVRVLAALTPLVGLACEPGDSGRPVARGNQAARSKAPASEQWRSPVASPLAQDVKPLLAPGPQERVLAFSGDSPFVTVGEFNAWLGTYPLWIASGEPEVARRSAVEQMVAFKLIAERARAAGYEERIRSAGHPADAKSLVLSYLRDQLAILSGVSDQQLRDYGARNPERLAQAEAAEAPAEIKVMALASSVRGEQLAAEIRTWTEQAAIRYAESAP